MNVKFWQHKVHTQPKGPFPRNMTKEEFDGLINGCLFCSSPNVYAGPEGGLNTNFICDNCGARYNLAQIAPPFGCQITHGPRKEELSNGS